MKATIDFDQQLYRRLKIEAARQGRTVRELVAEAVQRVLDAPPATANSERSPDEWRPAWFGSLSRYAQGTDGHSMQVVRRSIARGRRSERAP